MAQIERIKRMEGALDEARAALDALDRALAGYEAALPAIRALQAYYESPVWLADYEADEAGLFPADLRRGVLSEDAVYDLLADQTRLRETMRRLSGGAGAAD